MKTIVSSLVLLGCLVLPAARSLRAGEPAPSPRKGRMLVLENQHTLEGDIERVGDRYRVRRPVGETWVPADRVLCLAATPRDAYVYLRGRANLEDPDERLRLANWCRLNGLRPQALTELRVAVQLRPDHGETQRLLAALQEDELTPQPEKSPAVAVEVRPGVPAPTFDVTTDSLGLFATRVQPILMNTCASCHATGRGGEFRLIQAYEGGIANRRTLERNLSAVLAQVDLSQPEASRLLTKAISDHAHIGQAPLKARTVTPYRTLEAWVKLTVANNPHLRDSRPASAVPSSLPLPPRRSADEPGTRWGEDAQPSSAAPPAASGLAGPVSSAAPAPPPPPPSAAPVDPYDPEPFNRQIHPQTKKPEPQQ